MSYVCLPFGLIQKDIKCLPYIENEDTNFQTRSLIWLITSLIFKSTYLLRAGMEILSKKKSVLLWTMGSIIMRWYIEH